MEPLLYGGYLGNVHFSYIPHTFIPHYPSFCRKIRIKFSANYPLTTFCNLHSAKYPFPNSVVDVCTVNAFKACLDKFLQHQALKFNFTAYLVGIGNRSEEVIK